MNSGHELGMSRMASTRSGRSASTEILSDTHTSCPVRRLRSRSFLVNPITRTTPATRHGRALARSVADIPGSALSSSDSLVVGPGGVLVVDGVGFEAAVEDADEAVGDLAQRGLVADAAVAELLVVGLCAW